MSILTNTVDAAQNAATQVRNIIRQQFTQLNRSGTMGYNLIWKNPNATPADVIAALGTDAQSCFQLAALNIDTVTAAATIGGITPPTLPSVPSQYTLTFDENGNGILTVNASSSSAGA